MLRTKIILSRKGFDSGYGKQPSPILPDGTLLSFPIPSKYDGVKYSEIKHQEKTYFEIIKELNPKSRIKEDYRCHIDPDIRYNTLQRKKGWNGLFGQMDAAQGHLRNKGVQQGDIFLFFGWFKETEKYNGKFRFKENAPDLHVIFGYLQISKIYESENDLPDYAEYHPHANNSLVKKNNCIYEASDFLSLQEELPGFGCIKYNQKAILTKRGEKSRSHWHLPDFFNNIKMSYHSKNSFESDFFKSADKGQEFVIESNEEVIEWARDIIISGTEMITLPNKGR